MGRYAKTPNWLSGDIPDTEIPTDTVFIPDISEDEGSLSELVDAEIDDYNHVITDGESQPYGPEKLNTALAVKDVAQSQQMAANTPLMFIENVGQFDDDVRFKLQGGEHTMFFTEDAVWLTASEPVTDTRESCNHPSQGSWQREANPESCKPTTWRGNHIKMSFAEANPNFRVVGINPIETTISFFEGSDPSQWQADVPVYAGVRLENVYPGIDIEYTGSNGQLTPQVVARGRSVNISRVALDIEGATVSDANRFGKMALETSIGEVQVPLFSQMGESELPTPKPHTDGKRVLNPILRVSQQTYVEDRVIVYSTLIGGDNQEYPTDLAVDEEGNVYITGVTYSEDFPVTPGAFETFNQVDNHINHIVLKLNNEGSELLYATYLGTDNSSFKWNAISIDLEGYAYIVGRTNSANFPTTTGAYQTNYKDGGCDAFITKISPDGTSLSYSTYIGGTESCENINSVVVDEDGSAYVTGITSSSDYPTTSGVVQPTFGDTGIIRGDAFVTKLNAIGSQLVFSTFLGGNDLENGWGSGGIALDSDGNIYIAGTTESEDFPTTADSYQPNIADVTPNYQGDGFITKLTADGSQLIYSTYIGGSDEEIISGGRNIVVDNDGFLYVIGGTTSTNFPTTVDAYQPNIMPGGNFDFFISKLDIAGSDLIFSTYLGGSEDDSTFLDHMGHIDIDSSGNIYLFGETNSTDFPTTEDAFQSVAPEPYGYDQNAFVTKLSSDGSALLYSTYLGGHEGDNEFGGGGIVVHPTGVFVAGDTYSENFPITSGAYQTSVNNYSRDIFVTKLDIVDPGLFFGQDWNVECPFCNVADTQGVEYGINTRTGNFGHMDTALSLPTAGGSLDFRYGYISQATDMYTTTLGNGWVHNHELQLHISDPALTHTVILQAPGGSRFPYTGNGDGTYEKYAGVTADMVYNDGADEFVVTTFNQYEFTFDGDGQLQEQKDPFGNLTTFSYSNGKLHQAVQGSRSLTYSYNGDQLSSVLDSSGRTVILGYTGDDLTSVTALMGTMTYQYADGDNLLTDVVDPSGRTVKEIAYDSSGQAHELRNGNGDLLVDLTFPQTATAPLMMSTELASQMAATADTNNADLATDVQVVVNGVTMTHVYNSRGVLTDVAYDCDDGTAGCGAGSDTGYDYNFKQTAMADANGNDTQLRWNEGGSNIEFVADALGNGTALSYDSFNNLTQTVDARGITTTLYYENPVFPTFRTRTVDALGHTQLYTPTVAGVDGAVGGLLKAEQDASGMVTTYQYNDQGQILETVRAAGTSAAVMTSYGYDTLGRMITTTQSAEGESHTTLNVYNSSDRLEATISNWTGSDPAAWAVDCDTSPGERDSNVCTRYGYDAAGRTISTTNTLGQTSLSFYDGAGRSYLSINNWDRTLYSEATALTDLCDFANPDPEQNLCSLTEYDSVGRVVTTTNSLGVKNVTEYDSLGRVGRTVSNWDDGVFVPGGYTVGSPIEPPVYIPSEPDRDIETRYAYDAVGNTVLVTDTMGSATRTFYDELNRVSGSIDAWSGYTLDECFNGDPERDEDICTGYVYDEVGNTIIVTDTLGRMTRTFYDALNRTEATVSNWNPATLSSAEACVVAADNVATDNICTLYGYDTAGRQITTTNALNQTSLTVYDGANRPYLTVQNWDGTPINSEADCQFPPAQADTNLCSVTYFDALGRRSSSKNPLGQVSDVDYDGLGRVITNTGAQYFFQEIWR